MLSRGLRNKNPGNIRINRSRFQGEVVPSSDSEFKEFMSLAWGYRAMFLIIHNYNQLYGINTLDKIIGRWAPEEENDTNAYISVVAKRLNCSRGSHIDSLNPEIMIPMVWSMSKIENGVDPELQEIEVGWKLFIEDVL